MIKVISRFFFILLFCAGLILSATPMFAAWQECVPGYVSNAFAVNECYYKAIEDQEQGSCHGECWWESHLQNATCKFSWPWNSCNLKTSASTEVQAQYGTCTPSGAPRADNPCACAEYQTVTNVPGKGFVQECG